MRTIPYFFLFVAKTRSCPNKSHKPTQAVVFIAKIYNKTRPSFLLTRENHVETNSRRNNRGGGTSSCRSCVCVCVYACVCVFLSFRIYTLQYFNNSLTQKERQVIVPVRVRRALAKMVRVLVLPRHIVAVLNHNLRYSLGILLCSPQYGILNYMV